MQPFTPPVIPPSGPLIAGGTPLGGAVTLVLAPIIVGAVVALIGYVIGFLVDAVIGDGAGCSPGEVDSDVMFCTIIATVIGALGWGWLGGMIGFVGGAGMFGLLGERAGSRTWAKRFARSAFGLGFVVGLGAAAWGFHTWATR